MFEGMDSFLALLAADRGIHSRRSRELAIGQLDYMLGKTTGQSYVVGFGLDPPLYAFHAAALVLNTADRC